MARCRGCQAEIDFVRLNSGKLMPVESQEPETYRLFAKKAWAEEASQGGPATRVVLVVDGELLDGWQAWRHETTPAGGTIRVPVDGPMRLDGVESHFAHCPASKDFRR